MCPELNYLKERGVSSRGQKTLSKLLYLHICKMRIIVIILKKNINGNINWKNINENINWKNINELMLVKCLEQCSTQNISYMFFNL